MDPTVEREEISRRFWLFREWFAQKSSNGKISLVDSNMHDRSGQDVGTIVTHNLPKIRVNPTVEEWEIGQRRWQVWGGFSETFKLLDPNCNWYPLLSEWRQCVTESGSIKGSFEDEEVAGLVVEVAFFYRCFRIT